MADDQASADGLREIAESEWDSDALAALPEDQRTLLEQLVIDGKTYAATSQERGMTVHRVRALERDALAAAGKQVAVLHEQGRVDCSRVTQTALAFLNWIYRREPGYREVPRAFDVVQCSTGIPMVQRRSSERRDPVLVIHMTAMAWEREYYDTFDALGLARTPRRIEKNEKKIPADPPVLTVTELGNPVPRLSVTLRDVQELGVVAFLRVLLKHDFLREVFVKDDRAREVIRSNEGLRAMLLEDDELRELILGDHELRKLFPERDEFIKAFRKQDGRT